MRGKHSPFAGRALSTPVLPTPFGMEETSSAFAVIWKAGGPFAGDIIDIEIRDDVDGQWGVAGS
jgi:hypothetical protein